MSLEVREEGGCFVCGTHNAAGLKARIVSDAAQRTARCRVTFPAHYQGWEGVLHGGLLATLLDEVSIYAGRTICPDLVTAELNVRYKKPVPVGVEVEFSARVTGERRRLLDIEATATVAGAVHAEAKASVFMLGGAAPRP